MGKPARLRLACRASLSLAFSLPAARAHSQPRVGLVSSSSRACLGAVSRPGLCALGPTGNTAPAFRGGDAHGRASPRASNLVCRSRPLLARVACSFTAPQPRVVKPCGELCAVADSPVHRDTSRCTSARLAHTGGSGFPRKSRPSGYGHNSRQITSRPARGKGERRSRERPELIAEPALLAPSAAILLAAKMVKTSASLSGAIRCFIAASREGSMTLC